jgi:hypothetical protein
MKEVNLSEEKTSFRLRIRGLHNVNTHFTVKSKWYPCKAVRPVRSNERLLEI